MQRIFATFALAITLAATLLALPTHAVAQGFDISKGIVGNLASQACREQGDCGWCDFVDLMVVIQKIILYLFGGLAICMIIWGGFGIVTAAGNQEKITSKRKLIISTLFGVLIILAAYFVTGAVVGILATPTNTTTEPAPLLGQKWWHDTLQCYTPLDGNKFCATAPNGSLCYNQGTKPSVCSGGTCSTETDAACISTTIGLGSSAKCGPITRQGCATSGSGTPALRASCKSPNCTLDVCAGNDTQVCCLPDS